MIIPELPDYLTSMGGAEYKGLIISLFTLTAGLSRPFSGKLTDTIGRIPVMIFGAAVCAICAVLYPAVGSVFLFLLLRFVHGLSTGFKPTATAAFVADIVPVNRRGEAMGLLGFFGSLGMAFGPTVGSFIAAEFSLETMFYTSSIVAFLSVAILFQMKETLKEPQKFSPRLLKINTNDFIYKPVFPAAIVMMTAVLSFGVILTFIPDFTKDLHIVNKGTFFLYYTIATLLVRVFAGRLSDRLGRVLVIRLGITIIFLNTLMISHIESATQLKIAAFIYGIGTGFTTPSLFAWTVDLCNDANRGRAFATLYIALEIGIGAGALFAGMINNSFGPNYLMIFSLSTISSALGIIYLFFFVKRSDHEHHLQKQ
jgi:MFS family permease